MRLSSTNATNSDNKTTLNTIVYIHDNKVQYALSTT